MKKSFSSSYTDYLNYNRRVSDSLNHRCVIFKLADHKKSPSAVEPDGLKDLKQSANLFACHFSN